MNTVILIPNVNTIEYACYLPSDSESPITGVLHAFADDSDLTRIIRSASSDTDQPEDILANTEFVIRLPYTASVVKGPTQVSEQLLEALEELVPDAPLHLPRCIELIRACQRIACGTPVFVVSETSFFIGLSEEESVYAIDFKLQQKLRARRFGFHGIYHRDACMQAMRHYSSTPSPKIISICLEPRPELTASIGTNPVMISGGMTPLEGLCGLTACGDIDPGIVLELARTKGWGHDRINRCLGQESGMRGLVGKPVTWESLFDEDNEETKLAREVFQYQLLRCCGSAISAMGGVDAVVINGRGAACAETMAARLMEKLYSATSARPELIQSDKPLYELIARECMDELDHACQLARCTK